MVVRACVRATARVCVCLIQRSGNIETRGDLGLTSDIAPQHKNDHVYNDTHYGVLYTLDSLSQLNIFVLCILQINSKDIPSVSMQIDFCVFIRILTQLR
jgi:hypothetical protein